MTSANPAMILGLADAIGRVRAATTPAEALERAGVLVESARSHCGGGVDLDALTEAAATLLDLIGRADRDDRPALARVAHGFIDLARLRAVRRAAYPADADEPGGRFLDLIIQLIERSDFTVGRMLRQRAAQYPNKTLFTVPHGESARDYTWTEVVQTTTQLAGAILDLAGDDAVVAIYAPNRVEGALIDIACLANGIFNTMVPANVVDAQLEHILSESGTRLLVVAGTEQLPKALAAHERVPSLEWIVTLDELPTVAGTNTTPLSHLLARGRTVSNRVLDERVGRVRALDIATTMYTSGTTGMPKGIKFSHLNLVSKRFARAAALPALGEDDVFLCFLPLYHTFGRWLEMMGAMHLAATYVFAESASTETLVRHMKRFRPTVMISVPKKWIDLHRRIVATDEPPDDPAAIRRAVQELTGGRLRWGLSAAGRLDPAIFRFFQLNGVELLSGYGMTEATGGITMTPPGGYVDDSIGKALPAIELGFGEDQELQLRGPYLTPGYTDPRDDASAFRDGWFCTGDIVSVDAAGYLRHVDRKKEIYKNASGRTIAPQRVEKLFADFPEVSRVFAVGDGREYVTLLIRPNTDYPEMAFDRMSEDAKREYFRGLVASCNRFLAPFERVVTFAIVDRDFSLARGELTHKGSFRRSIVEENFRKQIDKMYASATIERVVDGIRVKIPFSFLQHLGVTETGTRADADGLLFQGVEKKLHIRRDSNAADRVWIGNCCYDLPGMVIDLDDWLRLPELWVGNAELTHVAGDNVLLWSLSIHDRPIQSRLVRVDAPRVPIDEWKDRLAAPRDATPSFLSVHAAAVALSGGDRAVALKAVDYLVGAMNTGRIRYQELAQSHLQHASRHPDEVVRSRAFVALYAHQPAESFGATANMFCGSLQSFLDPEACAQIAMLGVRIGHWAYWKRALVSLRKGVAQSRSADAALFAMRMLRSLGHIAEQQDDFYLPVRRELMAWMLAPVSAVLRDVAAEIVDRLAQGLRQRLGARQMQAVDPKTGRSYTWADALRFEDGIDANERVRMKAAMETTELIREAVYVLHQERTIDLEDIGPDRIWISLIATRFGTSVYHVGVRLRSGERCDFNLYVRSTTAPEAFLTDLRLMCVGAGDPGENPLCPQVGGYWPEYGIATIEHLPGESVEALVQHMHEHPDREVCQRIRNAWPHLSWSALTAAFEFYRRTESQWSLTGSVARDITVPLNDYGGEARILAAAGWQPFAGTLDMMVRLRRAFLERIRFHYPSLDPETDDDVLFAGAIEACGLREGLAFLDDAIAQAERAGESDVEIVALGRRMRAYVERIRQSGYMPKSVHFAIRRYQTWSQQVPDAGVHARAAQLRELQNNYRMDEARGRFPGSRLWLYAETVLKDSPPEGRAIIEQAIRRMREGADIQEVLGRLYKELREKLPSHDQQYFLTRAAYPHLELNEKAELISSSEIGPDRAELVTLHTDRTDRELRIRPPTSSRELDTLNRIFYVGGIGGGLTTHEKFLVAVDHAGYVMGGAGYIRRTPAHVILDKIAVLPRCRGRGIGEILLQEFIRRVTGEGAAIVSAEFIHATWLEQFGFHSHPHYAGVVLPIRHE